MDEIFLSAFPLPLGSNYAAATSVPQIPWTTPSDVSFHVPAASTVSSMSTIGDTRDTAVNAPVQHGTSWMGASSLGPIGHIHTPHVQEALVHTTTMAPEPASTSSCRILSDIPCTQPLDGSLLSVRNHLSTHWHKHQKNEVVQCPWAGCPDKLRWMNVPRHIRSIHLGVRMVCPNCERPFTRSLGLAKHISSKKCSRKRFTMHVNHGVAQPTDIDDLKARGSDMHDLVPL